MGDYICIMGSNKKGQFQATVEYAKHLRKIGKKFFWSSERQKAKKDLDSLK